MAGAAGSEPRRVPPAAADQDLRRRLGVTIGALLVYRLGLAVPIPGLAPGALDTVYGPHRSLVVQILLGPATGAGARVSVFALGLLPYLTACVLIYLATFLSPRLAPLRRSPGGRARLERWSVVATLPLALLQGFAIATALRGARDLVADPSDGLFAPFAGLVMAAGTMLLIWLAGRITRSGIGLGIAVVLATGALMSLPRALTNEVELIRQGQAPGYELTIGLVALLGTIALAAFLDGAERRLPFAPPPGRTRDAFAYLPLRLGAGAIPAAISAAVAIMLLSQLPIRGWVQAAGMAGYWGLAALDSLVVFAFALVAAAGTIDAGAVAADLAASEAALEEAGSEDAADLLDRTQWRLAVPLAAAMALVELVPNLIYGFDLMQIFVGGSSLIMVAFVGVEVVAVLRSRRVPA